MAWVAVLVAGLLEIIWAFFMKQSQGFTKIAPSVITFTTMIVSFGLLSFSMRALPLGAAYAVWTGIGAIGTFVVGIVILGEQVSTLRVVAFVLIASGLLLMKLSSTH